MDDYIDDTKDIFKRNTIIISCYSMKIFCDIVNKNCIL